MPSKPPNNRPSRFPEFFSGLAIKLGPSLSVMGLGGVLTQYFQKNPNGMLVFTVLLAVGLIVTAAAIVSENSR